MSYNDNIPDRATRNKIYRSARLYIKTRRIGMCEALTKCPANLAKYNSYDMFDEKPNFPEIAKHRVPLLYYWFPLNDTQSRLNIFNEAILETDDN